MHFQRVCLHQGSRLAHSFVRRRMASDAARPRKRRKESAAAADAWQPEVQWGDSFSLPGLAVQNLSMQVPLVHGQPDGERITVFARMVSQPGRSTKPLLLFLQGGPGFESPRPLDAGGWLKKATEDYRVVLLDQRGTGLSTGISAKSLLRRGSPAQQAEYLTHFRAESIVPDAEALRQALLPGDGPGSQWSVLGQSFGGFCSLTYLSTAPAGLNQVMLTGGMPPGIGSKCSADVAYRRLFRRVITQNEKFYRRFPGDVAAVQKLVRHLAALPDGGAQLSTGSVLTPRGLQTLGLAGLGMSSGFERLHYLLESAFDADGDLSPAFLKAVDSWHAWDSNPLYAILHESIYCQGGASAWAAERIRGEAPFAELFNAVARAEAELPVYFTGEMIFPWMFDEVASLRELKPAAELLAAKDDWPPLYDCEQLQMNKVPVASATYFEDMYVDFDAAQETAAQVDGIQQWITNEYRHSGIRDDGLRIFETLNGMCKGTVLTFA